MLISMVAKHVHKFQFLYQKSLNSVFCIFTTLIDEPKYVQSKQCLSFYCCFTLLLLREHPNHRPFSFCSRFKNLDYFIIFFDYILYFITICCSISTKNAHKVKNLSYHYFRKSFHHTFHELAIGCQILQLSLSSSA